MCWRAGCPMRSWIRLRGGSSTPGGNELALGETIRIYLELGLAAAQERVMDLMDRHIQELAVAGVDLVSFSHGQPVRCPLCLFPRSVPSDNMGFK